MADKAARIEQYQRNCSFAAFILIVTFAAFVFLTEHLSNVLIPLIWSAFFALPLTSLICVINEFLVKGWTSFARCCSGRAARRAGPLLKFTAKAGENCVYLDDTPESAAIVKHLEDPCFGLCGIFSCCGCFGFKSCATFVCQPRIRIVDVEGVAEDSPEVNRLVKNWTYYAVPKDQSSDSGSRSNVSLELYLDQAGHYPAAVPTSPAQRSDELTGSLELDTTSAVTWIISVVIAMSVLLIGVYGFVTCLSCGVQALKKNTGAYERGLKEFLISAESLAKNWLPEDTYNDMQTQAQDFAATSLPALVSTVADRLQIFGFETTLFVIYVFFWIFEPLPVDNSLAQVVRNYLLLKTMVCLLFASLMSGLLYYLNCKLWNLFFIVTFLLNYIPEVGAILSAVALLPAILFDGNLPYAERKSNTFQLIVFGTLFKVLCGNVIEVRLYSSQGGEHMRMHPVVIMALMMLCEALMGVSGMFLAIPIAAAFKYYAVSGNMPDMFLHPFLVFMEGDETGPHKNFVDRWRVGYGSTQGGKDGAEAAATSQEP